MEIYMISQLLWVICRYFYIDLLTQEFWDTGFEPSGKRHQLGRGGRDGDRSDGFSSHVCLYGL